jgi:hypothetical protein
MKKHSLIERTMKLIYWPLLCIRSILFPLYKIPFVIIMLLLGYYALCINDQGQDMMASFTAKSIFRNSYLALFDLFLVGWAISIWNVARVLLVAANLKGLVEKQISEAELKKHNIDTLVQDQSWIVASVDNVYKKVLGFMSNWTPRLLAMCPYLIFIKGYLDQHKAFKGEHWENIFVIVVAAAIHMFYMIYRLRLWGWIVKSSKQDIPAKRAGKRDLNEEKNALTAMEKSGTVINTILTVVMTVVMFVYALHAARDSPDATGKPGLIILSAFTLYTLTGLLFNLLVNNTKIPVFLILLIMAFFWFSGFNNNHTIQTLATPEDKQILSARNSRSDSSYFDYWLRNKIKDSIFTGSPNQAKQTIFIVAAEGGGIRNCYWTYKVLSELQSIESKFYNRTFSVTGVSGGSIGLGFYYNFINHSLDRLNGSYPVSGPETKIDSICSADYLSRVTFGFLFPDYIQRFLPFPVESWDRSKHLANSFDDGFSTYLQSKHLLSANYLRMWADSSTAYRYPALLFNTILNEQGAKAIYSPFPLSNKHYAGVVDLLSVTNRPVPMKEAMVSSARFPILTAPGLVWYDKYNEKTKKIDSVRLGHISDGGGYENTGIQTAEQTAMLVQSRLFEHNISHIKVQIIYVGTGIDSIEVPERPSSLPRKYNEAADKSYEIAWLGGATSALFGWIKGAHNISVRLNPQMNVLQFGLQIKTTENKHTLPLGWFLSDTSRLILQRQARYSSSDAILRASYNAFRKISY